MRYTETWRGESGEEPQIHVHRGKFPKQNTNDLGLRSRINKWDLLKLKRFCNANDTVNNTNQQPTDRENIFTNSTAIDC